MGVQADATALPAQRPTAQPWHLWPENLPAWQLWMAVQTQWRRAGMSGVRSGLDYAGVQVAIERSGTRRRRWSQRFVELQVMERAALKVWADQAEAQAKKAKR